MLAPQQNCRSTDSTLSALSSIQTDHLLIFDYACPVAGLPAF